MSATPRFGGCVHKSQQPLRLEWQDLGRRAFRHAACSLLLSMTPLAQQADQAVRHAVDAYIDGRLLPMFEGDSSFETRNSAYRLVDGVLASAPDRALVGAELVGWLIEYVSRSEVSSTWKPGARAVLVDTRNDGVRGPQIVVTSATRSFRTERLSPVPKAPAPAAPIRTTGSMGYQGGSSSDHLWPAASKGFAPADFPVRSASPPPPAPAPAHKTSWSAPPPPPAMITHAARFDTLPPPPPIPSFADAKMPERVHGITGYSARPATLPPPPAPRPLPRALPPPHVIADGSAARPYLLTPTGSGRSRAHQRGLPIR
ncbi:MAG: hypothetical protein IPK82_43875 [Polyangiaceae bacterium]|nr:hypothetical protein [Polyangiaceae bacterium]